MGASSHLAKAAPVAWFLLLALSAALPREGYAQQATPPQRAVLANPDRDAYLDDLIRSAPKEWAHGKNWVLITPYVFGRNVAEPRARTLCPDEAGLVVVQNNGTEVPPWIYSSPDPCNQLAAATGDSAVLVLEDRKDRDAAYLLFVACDAKRRDKHCDLDPFGGEGTMKLEESDRRGQRQFTVLAPNTDNKTSRFSVGQVWRLRNPLEQRSVK